MALSIWLSELRTGAVRLFERSDKEDISILGSDGRVIASVPSQIAQSPLYTDLDDLLAGIEVDESDTSVVREDWLE